MAIQLTFENGDVVRCIDLDDAKSKAIASAEGRAVVEIFPEGGGPVTTLEFDRTSHDWISVGDELTK